MAQLYFEDFPLGSRWPLGPYDVSRDEIVRFARDYDPQGFHLNETEARNSLFGGVIASGWHICAIVMRMMVDSYLHKSANMGSPGIDSLRWKTPVRPGDTLSGHAEIIAARPSRSRPELGILTTRYHIANQNGETVMTMEGANMVRRRSAGTVS